jgi:N6-adenosine-specific RNA methylase IME4
VREHSRKPDEAFAAAEELCGDVHRLELFSRQSRDGWDSFGDEVDKDWSVASAAGAQPLGNG